MTRVTDPNNISLESLVEFTRTGISLNLEALDEAGGDVTAGGVLIPALFNDTPYLTYNSCILNNPLLNVESNKTCKECSPDPNAMIPDWRTLQDGDIYFNDKNCTYDIVKDCYKISANGKISKKSPIIGYPTEREIENLKEFALSQLLKEFAKTDIATAVIYVPDNFGVMTQESFDSTKNTEYFRQLIQNSQKSNPGSIADAILLSGYYDDENTQRQIPPPIKNFTRVVQEIDIIQELKKYLTYQVYVNVSEVIPTKILLSLESKLLEIVPQIVASTPGIPSYLYTQTGQEVTILGKDFHRAFNRVSNSLTRAANFIDNLVVEQKSIFYIRVDETGNNDVPIALDTRLYTDKLIEFKRSLLFSIKRAIGIRLKELDKVIISFDSGQGQAETEDEETLYLDARGNPIPTPPKIRIKNIIGNKFGCPDVVIYDREEENYRTKSDINDIFDGMRDSTLNGYILSIPDMLIALEGKEDLNWIDYILRHTYPGLIVKDRLINPGDELSKCINTKSLNGLVNNLISELIEFPNLFLNSITDSVCSTKEQLIDEETNIERVRRQIREQLAALATQSEIVSKNSVLASLASINPETTSLDFDKLLNFGLPTTPVNTRSANGTGPQQSYFNDPNRMAYIQQDILRKLEAGEQNQNIRFLTEKALEDFSLGLSGQTSQIDQYNRLIEDYQKSLRITKGIPFGNTTVQPSTKTTNPEAVEKAIKEIEAVNRALELVKQYQDTTTKEIIKNKFLTTTTKSLQRAEAATANKPMVNLIIQLILGAIAGEDSGLGAVLSQQTMVDMKGATKLHRSSKKAKKAKKMPLIENAGDNKLASLLNNLNSGGGWCAWVAMIQEAAQCILKGLGLADAKTAIIKAALKKLTPFEWQKLFRNMPPEIRGRIYEKINKTLPDLIGVLFPWQENLGTGNFRPDLALQDARQQILRDALFYKIEAPVPLPPVITVPISYSVPVIRYRVNQYVIDEPERTKLDNFIKFVVENELVSTSTIPAENTKIDINIFGHASTTAKQKTNLPLSERRAAGVLSYLSDSFAKNKITVSLKTQAFGETIPVELGPQEDILVENSVIVDEFESSANRRTEIFITFNLNADQLTEKAKSAALGIIKAQDTYNQIYEKNASAYGDQGSAAVAAVSEIVTKSSNLGTTLSTIIEGTSNEGQSGFYYTGSEEYPDSIYPGAGIGPDGNPNGDNPTGYLNDYLAAGYGQDGLQLYVDPLDPFGYKKVTPPPANTGGERGETLVYSQEQTLAYETDAIAKAYGYLANSEPNYGLSKGDIAYSVMISEANYYGTFDPTDIAGNQKTISNLMRLSDAELLNRGAQAVYRKSRQDYIDKRLAAGAGARFSGALGEITTEAIDIIIDTFIDLIGVDILLDELNNLPGIGLVKKIIRDINCLIPPMPYLKPSVEQYIKSIRFDLCYIGQKGYKATSIMSTPPMLYGKAGYALFSKGWGQRARKILVLIGMKAADLLLDLLTQILIKALVKVIETILDLTCSLVAEAAANLASMATKNTDFLTKLKNAICPDSEINDQAFGEGLANVLEALYPPGSPESSCAASLNGTELASFLDAIIVTLSYGQLYDLLLGNASDEALKIITSIAVSQGGCISQIFGDATNVANYFSGLGKLIGAQDIFTEFPANVSLTPNATICPPNTFQTLRDLRQSLLEDKGLTPEQVKEQLDFLQDQALQKLQDLTRMLNDGPFTSLEDLVVANPGCSFNGIIQEDPYSRNIRNNTIETIISPIERAVMRDLIGADGAINMILADTNGADLRLHRQRVRDFGNSIGQTNNLPHEYYSDNTIRKSYIEDNKLVIVNNKKDRLDQFGRKMPLARTDKGPVGGFGPTIGAYLMNKFQKTRIGLVDYSPGNDSSKIDQQLIEFKTKRADISLIAKRQQVVDFNNQLIAERKDRIAKFCIATGFIDAEIAAEYMLASPNEETYRYTSYIKSYFDYDKRKAVFIDMINVIPKVFPSTDINFPDYSPEKRVERCLGQPKNPELREFSYSGSSIGLNYSFKEKVRKSYNNGETELVVGLQKTQPAFTTFSMTSTMPIEQRDQILDSISIKMNREMMGYYLECWYAYNNESEGINDEERKKHYKPFQVNGLYYNPDAKLRKSPLVTSSELAFTYITYPKMYGGILGSGIGSLASPEYAFDLTYDFNLEDENGNFRPEYKNQYSVTLTERFNPFDDTKLKIDQKQALKEYYNLIMSSPNTKTEDGEETGDLEGYPSIGLENTTIDTFSRRIISTPDPDVLSRTENLLSISNSQEIQYSFESEAFLRFLQEKLNQSDNLSDVLNNFVNTNTRNSVNNLFDFINDGLVKRLTHFIGSGDNANEIKEFDLVADIKEYTDYSKEDKISQSKTVKVPKGFLFGFDPEMAPTVHILDPSKYGGNEDNPPYYIEPPKYQGWMGLAQKMFPERDGCEPARSYISSMPDLKEYYQKIENLYANDERLAFDPLCTKEAPYDQIFQSSVVAQLEIVLKATVRTYLLEQMLRMVPLISTFQPNDNNFDELIYIYLADTILNEIKKMDMKRPFPERGPGVTIGENRRVFLLNEVSRRYNYFYGILEQTGFSILKRIDAGLIAEDTLGPTQQTAVKNIREAISSYYEVYDGTEAVLSDESISAQTVINRAINGVISRKVNPAQGLGGSSFDKLRAKRIKKAAIYQALQETEQDARILFSIYLKEEFANLSKIMTEKLEPSVEGLDLLFLSSPIYVNGAVTKIRNERGTVIGYQGPYDVMSNPTRASNFNIDLAKFTVQNSTGEFVNKSNSTSTNLFEFEREIDNNSKESWPFVLERYITTDEPVVTKIKDRKIYDAVFNRDEKLFDRINFNDWDEYIKNLIQSNENFRGNISNFWGREEGKSGWRWGVRLSMAFGPTSEYYQTFRAVIDSMPEEIIKRQKAFRLVSNQEQPENYIILIPICSGELDIPDQDLSLFSLDQFDLPCTIMEMIKTTDFRFVTKYLFPQKRYLSLLGIYTMNSFFDSIGNAGSPSEGGDRWTIPGGRRNSSFRKWDKGNIFYDPQKLGNDAGNVLMNTFMALYRARAEFANHSGQSNRKTFPNLKDFFLSLLPDPIIPDIPWFQRKNVIPRPYDMFDEECLDNQIDDIDEGEI